MVTLKCPTCVTNATTSKIEIDAQIQIQESFVPAYFDETGVFVAEVATRSIPLTCSLGHQFAINNQAAIANIVAMGRGVIVRNQADLPL